MIKIYEGSRARVVAMFQSEICFGNYHDMVGVKIICSGALSDAFQSWMFCWVVEVMLLGVLRDVFYSWNFCWVLEVMLMGVSSDVFSPGYFVG